MAAHGSTGVTPVGRPASHLLARAGTADDRATQGVTRLSRRLLATQFSAVVGSIILATVVTTVAGNPLRLACSCTSASLSAR